MLSLLTIFTFIEFIVNQALVFFSAGLVATAAGLVATAAGLVVAAAGLAAALVGGWVFFGSSFLGASTGLSEAFEAFLTFLSSSLFLAAQLS